MKLILLRCPNCSQPLKPNNDDVILACENCHTPVAIATNGPVKMAVQYGRPVNVQPDQTRWMPFWVIQGKVDITRRETQGGRSLAKEAQAFLAIEARRRDWLRNLDFELRLGEPELWALPEHAY